MPDSSGSARARRKAGRKTRKVETLALDTEAVRYWRLQRGLTQQALAERRIELDGQPCGISYAQVRRIESSGRCGPTSARILAGLLGVSLAELSPRDALRSACGLPREVSSDFVGRATEIAEVLDTLRVRSSTRVAVSIEGLPGIGKTELALQVCGICEREARFRVFWLDAADPDLTRGWADVVATHLGIEGQKPEERAKRALRAVESLTEPVLLVLDNVEEWTASRPWPRPRGPHIRWLATTRSGELGGRQFHHVRLPSLDPASGKALMSRIAGPDIVERDGFFPLLEVLGGYTLSVELAATFLRRFPEVSPAQYLADLESGMGPEREEEVGRRSLYGGTLETALDLLWARLPPRIRRSWQVAACFAQAPATAALSDSCGLDRRRRAELRDYHLIQNDGDRAWSMHRLLRDFGRRAGEAESLVVAQRSFLAGCVERSRPMGVDAGHLIYSPDRAHFDRALEGSPASPMAEQGDSFANLQARVGAALCSLGEYRAATAALERALEHQLSRTDPNPVATLEIRRDLGFVLSRSGDWSRACQIFEQGILEATSAYGETHEIIADLLNGLAVVSAERGDLRRARSLYERALDVALRVRGEKDHEVAIIRGNLGLVLRRIGEPEAARALMERSLDSLLVLFGADDPRVAHGRRKLAGALLDIGDAAGARALLEQALESELVTLGNDHPEVADTRNSLAGALRRLGDHARARELFEEALASRLRSLGEDHPYVATLRSNLAGALHALGELESACSLFEQTIASGLETLGEDHPYVALRRANLAAVLLDMGELPRARALLEEALASTLNRFGESHPSVSALRSRLARLEDREKDECRSGTARSTSSDRPSGRADETP